MVQLVTLYDSRQSRSQTSKLQQALDDGNISYEAVATACLACMSEDDVAEMVRTEELLPTDDDDA